MGTRIIRLINYTILPHRKNLTFPHLTHHAAPGISAQLQFDAATGRRLLDEIIEVDATLKSPINNFPFCM